MRRSDVVTVLFAILMASLPLPLFTKVRHFARVSVTGNGLLELQISHGNRRFVETSLAYAESVNRIAVRGATDGFWLVRTVVRDGRLDNCITSNSPQDIDSFNTEFSQTGRNRMEVSENQLMNVYLKLNKTNYLSGTTVRGKDNRVSNGPLVKTNYNSAVNLPDFNLWARISSTGNSLFWKKFRPHLQMTKKTRECNQFYTNTIKSLQAINTGVYANVSGFTNHTQKNKKNRHQFRHHRHNHHDYHRSCHACSYIESHKKNTYRTSEAAALNSSTPSSELSSVFRPLSKTWKISRNEANESANYPSTKQNTAGIEDWAKVRNGTSGLMQGSFWTPLQSENPTNRGPLIEFTDRLPEISDMYNNQSGAATLDTKGATNNAMGRPAVGRESLWQSGQQIRSKRDLLTGWMILPGTKWCGDGDIAEHKRDLGYHSGLDGCCRRHDLCPLVIPRLSWKYGIFNYRLHTLSHCRCDRKFRKCLKATSSPLAHLIGQIYFNVIGPECFRFIQKSTCSQRVWWGGCQEWTTSKVAVPKKQRSFK